jgi:hypothetical protein
MFVEDLTPFFEDFPAVDATLDGVPLRVIFDRPDMTAFGGIASTSPTATAPSASVSAGTTTASLLVVAGANAVAIGIAGTYRVRNIALDGTGLTTFDLELQ